ncbi:MAG: hypothetical protein ACTHU0_20895 [Kofleriaceae bacterium]
MRPALVACIVGCVGATALDSARAAPAADVVVAWSPGALGPIGDAISDVASRAGAAYVDASPEAVPLPDPRPLIKRGIASYGALEFDAAMTALDGAAAIVDQTGAAYVDATTLGDLFLHRALTLTQRGDDSRAWDDFVAAAGIDTTRVLDPAGFPPRAVERFQQARAQIAATPRGRIKLAGPAGCRIRIDGAPVGARDLELPFGRHWLDAACDGRLAVRQRLNVDREVIEVAIAGAEIAPPGDAALLIQARTAAARAILAVSVHGRTAVIRRIGVDGKEQDRASIALHGERDAREIAAAVSRLLTPLPVAARAPWYRSPWVWAAAGAAAASAVLIPLAVTRTGTAPDVTVRPTNVPEWK